MFARQIRTRLSGLLQVRFFADRPPRARRDNTSSSSSSSASSSASSSSSSSSGASAPTRLSESAKDELAALYAADPAQWTWTNLAAKFGIAPERARAVVQLRQLDRSQADAALLEAAYKDTRAANKLSEYKPADKARKTAAVPTYRTAGREYMLIDEDAPKPESTVTKVNQTLQKLRAQPLVPYADPFAAAPVSNDKESLRFAGRYRYRFVDVSDTATQENRAVWVREKDGSFVKAAEEETQTARRRYASPAQRKHA
jgi:hypothetical protein